MKYLGIDYGKSHVGIAFADTPLAEPLSTLNNKDFIVQVKRIVEDLKIDKVIVGDCPEEFLSSLKRISEVEQVDETLSSHDARNALLHKSKINRKEREHEIAAAIILQSWIDSCKV